MLENNKSGKKKFVLEIFFGGGGEQKFGEQKFEKD